MGATPCRVGLVLTLAALASGDVAEARRRRLELSKESCSDGSDGYLIELDPSVIPDAQHIVECGKKGGCRAFSPYMAAPSEQHAVRCCSDTRKDGWKKYSRCRRRLHGRRLALGVPAPLLSHRPILSAAVFGRRHPRWCLICPERASAAAIHDQAPMATLSTRRRSCARPRARVSAPPPSSTSTAQPDQAVGSITSPSGPRRRNLTAAASCSLQPPLPPTLLRLTRLPLPPLELGQHRAGRPRRAVRRQRRQRHRPRGVHRRVRLRRPVRRRAEVLPALEWRDDSRLLRPRRGQ